MSYEIVVDNASNIIVITTHGEFTNQKAMEQNVEAHALGKQLGIDRFLVDLTDSTNCGTTIEHYRFA